MTFEEQNKRLKEIIKLLEDKDTPLEDAVKLFEEGSKIAKNCIKELDKSKGKILEIKESLDNLDERG